MKYRAAAARDLQHTHVDVVVDDDATMSTIRKLTAAAVDNWGRLMGYTPTEWNIISMSYGRADLLRGTFPAS